MSDEPKHSTPPPASTPTGSQPQGQQPQQMQVPVDISGLSASYTNFVRVSVTPEELVLDFGVNTQQMTSAGPEVIKLTHRLVMSFYTAKRLLNNLYRVINLYETNYGVLELDPQKRVRHSSAPVMRPDLGLPGFGGGQS